MSSIKRSIQDYYSKLMNSPGRIEEVAGGFALGVFIAFSPWLGLHTVTALLLAFILRKSYAAAVLGTLVFNPMTGMFILLADFQVGKAFLRLEHVYMPPHLSFDLDGLSHLWRSGIEIMYPLFVGSLMLGLVAAAASYFLARRSLHVYRARIYARRRRNEPHQKDPE